MKLTCLLPLLLFHLATPPPPAEAAVSQQINLGFSAKPDPASSSAFQPLLADPTGSFSLGFLRVNSAGLDLAVIHSSSSLPLWRATPARPATWAGSTLSFNGSLVLSDAKTGVLLWSAAAAAAGGGYRLVLLNSSNLQIQKLAEPVSVLWQSFDFPSDTIVQGQDFASTAVLFSANQRFSMRLGANSIALHMEFDGGPAPMYWKHSALEAKAQIVAGGGPIYVRVDSVGYIGMYQNESAPVDVLPFDSFNRGVPGLRRLTLESDGNLRAYYWNGSSWVLDFKAITDGCGLPSGCGPYGLCRTGGAGCGCLDDRTGGSCFPGDSGDLCGGEAGYRVLRRKGVDLANKELLAFQKVGSLEECEGSCERNCSCWGAVYNNASGFCYRMDYPVQTVLAVGDERRVGYFKVRSGGGGDGGGWRKAETALLVVGAVIFAAGAGFGSYRIWSRRKMRARVDVPTVDGIFAGPYKGLRSSSSSSSRSIELSHSSFGK